MSNEIKVHWALTHCEGTLGLKEIYEDDNYVYLVLEYQPKGSLLGQVVNNRGLTELQVRVVMEQLLLTADFMHTHGVVHRDIKLDNILINKIDEEHLDVKVADFGLACFLPEEPMILLEDKCGTPGYVAPEILRGHGYREKADIFSLGAVLYNLLTGLYLFTGVNKEELLFNNKICNLVHVLPLVGMKCTPLCQDLLMNLLSLNAS